MPEPGRDRWRMRRILIWTGIVAVLAALAWRADFTSDLSSLMPTGDPQLRRQFEFFETRGVSKVIAVEAWAEDPALLDQAKAALRALSKDFAVIGARPISGGSANALANFAETIETHLPILLEPAELEQVAERMQPDRLREILAAIKERANRPEEQFAVAAAREDALALGGIVVESLRHHLPSGSSDGEIVIHPDGEHCLILYEVGFSPNDLGGSERLVSAWESAAAAAPPGIHLEAIGSYRHYCDNFRSIWHDLITTMPISLLLIAVLLYSLIRSWRAVLALHVPASLAFLGAVAVLAVTVRKIPMSALGFGAGFLGVAVENAIHMTLAIRTGGERHVRKPLVMSFLTTAVAFAVLAGSSIPALRCLGIQVVGGLLVALLASMTLLPALVPHGQHRDPWSPLSTRLISWSERRPRTHVLVAVAITLALVPGWFAIPAIGHPGLRLLDDLQKMDGSRPETWAALKGFFARWSAFEASDFIVGEGPDLDHALTAIADVRVHAQLPNALIERVLPSPGERERRIAAWNDFWREQPGFADDFLAACREVGLKPQAFAGTLARYTPITSTTLTLADWEETPLRQTLRTLVREGPVYQIASPLTGVPAERVVAIARELNAAPDGDRWIASRAVMGHQLVDLTRQDLAVRGLGMIVAMVVLVVALVRSLRQVLAIVVPPTIAMAWTYGLLGWIGEPLTPLSVMVAAFVAGIGLDTAMFLSQSERRAAALSPSLACAISTIAGVGSLLGASNPLLADAGMAVAIGMAACIVACVLLTPVLSGHVVGRREVRNPRAPGTGEQDDRSP
jgi:uncharacterized protein